MKPVDIIIPVYSGYAETIACLRSVLDAQCITAHEIIVIYDAGPDPRLFDYLESLASAGLIFLLVNSANLGFVKTVNRGLALHPERDVLLLNSDTKVANDWLDRLVACAQSDARIATVTPFSNNAEICSYPAICQSSELPEGWDVAQVDAAFARGVTPAAIDIPTAVGFCMFIARKAIDDVGHFNEELFGRGYGEENDLCRRLAASNWRNVLCTNVFVYHCGGVSFGAEKAKLVAAAMEILDKLYPDYHRLVHEFIRTDAPQKYRLQAQLASLDPSRPRVLFVTHNLDGGTAKHVRELAQYMSRSAYFFVVRMSSGRELELSTATVWGDIKLYFLWSQQGSLFLKVIAALGIGKIHIHHVKSLENFADYLVKYADIPYDITLHDYYLINGNPALADKSGKFCADIKTRDALCAEHSPVPLEYTAEQWRNFSEELLQSADRILAPSHYTANLFAEYFPSLHFTIAPHPDWEADAPYPAVRRSVLQSGEKLRIIALGALGLEKGADILEQVALLGEKLAHPVEFHLLGYAYRELHKSVIVHGPYDDSLLDEKLADIAPHLIWFPCQWPETYSYTLSACLRGGYPVLAPALGAFVERLYKRPLSWLQPFPVSINQWLTEIVRIRDAGFLQGDEQALVWEQQAAASSDKFNYAQDYMQGINQREPPIVASSFWFDILKTLEIKSVNDELNSRREKILRALLYVRQMRLMRVLVRYIPVSFQKRVKRALSPRALHQVARDLL